MDTGQSWLAQPETVCIVKLASSVARVEVQTVPAHSGLGGVVLELPWNSYITLALHSLSMTQGAVKARIHQL